MEDKLSHGEMREANNFCSQAVRSPKAMRGGISICFPQPCSGTGNRRGEAIKARVQAVSGYLSRNPNPKFLFKVALKTLIVIHRAFREVDPTFQEEIINYGRSRSHMLNLAHFKDDSSPNAWDYSAWVRAYALFLEERLECFRRTKDLDTKELLEHLPALQQLMYRVLGCQPQGAATHNFIIQLALSMVASESIKIYNAISDGCVNLVDKFFEMQKHDALKALDIYRKAGLEASGHHLSEPVNGWFGFGGDKSGLRRWFTEQNLIQKTGIHSIITSPHESLRKGNWVRLICGASFEDVLDIRNISLVYTLAGVDCIDCAAEASVVNAVHDGIKAAMDIVPVRRPWVMISVNDNDDLHIRKAEFDPDDRPKDCTRPCENICPADAIPYLGKADVSKGGILAERCYGCGRCLPICPYDKITVEILKRDDVDAIEIHTSGR
ncbi:hypothetical protein CASFOL_029099 [Castilleja foliolosa]|uniref:Uncharacterized protein n=1 Tax=Castilleja foliolosa TaxID=1961234 RepID=A0ABD3CEH3_9LAMI